MPTENSSTPVIALFGEVLADVFPDVSVLGGAPFNVARHLQAFGLQAIMVSCIGEDALGEQLLAEMRRLGMQTSGIQRAAGYPTGIVQVVMENGSHQFDILPDQAYDHIHAEDARQIALKTSPAMAYFGTLAQRGELSREASSAFLTSVACPVFLDINLRQPWFDREVIKRSLSAADIVKLNDVELGVVAEMLGVGFDDAEMQARKVQEQYKLNQVLVTCGAEGCWLLDGQQQIFRAKIAHAFPVIDTVGAGDAFAAVFMAGWLQGWAIPDLLQHACDYAALTCGWRGAAPPPEEIVRAFRLRCGL